MAEFIIIIRPEPDASRDVMWLDRYKVPAIGAPVMHAAPHRMDVPDPSSFQAIIFTSRHAVTAFVDVDKPAAWLSMPVYAVGRGTAQAAKNSGYRSVITGHGGGGGLVPLILANLRPENGKLFWPAAQSISFDMTAQLAPYDFVVDRHTAYAMPMADNLSQHLLAPLTACQSAAVVAMSARSLSVFRRLLDAAGCASYRSKITVIAGSAGIAAAAGPGWGGTLVARAPRRSRLLAIATMLHRRRTLPQHTR